MWEAAGVAAALAGGMAWSVRGRAAQVWGPSVWRGPRERKAIALTFDDGPSESTPRVLELLARHEAKATFFACGMHVRRLPEIARAIVDAGHEIGNHTESHAALYLKSAAFMEREIAAAQVTIEEVTGRRPELFRATYGCRWPGLRAAQKRHGLLGVMWTVIGRDWRWPGERVAERILHATEPGAIVCLHDGRESAVRPEIGATMKALAIALPTWRERGYKIVTVSELLCPTK